jgi:undecaprenyl-diphosphatase
LFVGTAITGIVGFPLFLLARGASRFGEILLALTGVALIMTGMIQKGAGSGGTKTARSLGTHEGIILGVAQGFSAIPGLSRSGLTSSVLLVRRYSGVEAFRISFLMSVPAVFAAALGLLLIEGLPPLDSGLAVAVAASFLSALLSIDLLLKLARRIRFWGLCVALGLLALLPQVFSLLHIRP